MPNTISEIKLRADRGMVWLQLVIADLCEAVEARLAALEGDTCPDCETGETDMGQRVRVPCEEHDKQPDAAPEAKADPAAWPGEGYRLLGKDELIEDGDEFSCSGWKPTVDGGKGFTVRGHPEGFAYRRKIAQPDDDPDEDALCSDCERVEDADLCRIAQERDAANKRAEEVEANIQKCSGCGANYYAQSFEYPCPWCVARKAQAKVERLEGAIKWALYERTDGRCGFCDGNIGHYVTCKGKQALADEENADLHKELDKKIRQYGQAREERDAANKRADEASKDRNHWRCMYDESNATVERLTEERDCWREKAERLAAVITNVEGVMTYRANTHTAEGRACGDSARLLRRGLNAIIGMEDSAENEEKPS